MNRRDDCPPLSGGLSRADYDRLGIELAASLRLYLQLLELNPFSPEVIRTVREIARKIVRQTPPHEAPLH